MGDFMAMMMAGMTMDLLAKATRSLVLIREILIKMGVPQDDVVSAIEEIATEYTEKFQDMSLEELKTFIRKEL